MSFSIPKVDPSLRVSFEKLSQNPVDCIRQFAEGHYPFIKNLDVSVKLVPTKESGKWKGVQCTHDKDNPSPHLTGTHVECIRHVDGDSLELSNILQSNPQYLSPMKGVHVILDIEEKAVVNLIAPASSTQKIVLNGGETYSNPLEAHLGDRENVVTRSQLQFALSKFKVSPGMVVALQFKGGEEQMESWPYLTNEAVQYLVECDFSILILNLPSMDRERDGGATSNHKLFFENPNRLIIESADLSKISVEGPVTVNFEIDRHEKFVDCASCILLTIES